MVYKLYNILVLITYIYLLFKNNILDILALFIFFFIHYNRYEVYRLNNEAKIISYFIGCFYS